MRFPISIGLAAVILTAGCGAPRVITTEDASPSQSTAAAPPPTTTTRPSNAHLANAFHFAADVAGQTGYYFTSPSGRWECAIIPRTSAGCQSAQSASIGIDGAPDEVPGPDGDLTTPNAIVVERTGEARFVAQQAPGFTLDPGPATELPFNRILAVAGFRCNIQETTGISCLSELSGEGFTFSAESYTTTYTDVPADAP